jgi:hypothetical protein
MLYHRVMKFIFQIHNSQCVCIHKNLEVPATAQLVLTCDEDKALSSMEKE